MQLIARKRPLIGGQSGVVSMGMARDGLDLH